DLRIDLVGRHLAEDLVLLHVIALADEPLLDRPLDDALSHLWHGHGDHRRLPGPSRLLHQMLIDRPSAARAASSTSSDSVGCACTVSAISCSVDSSDMASVTSAISSVASAPMMWQPRISP